MFRQIMIFGTLFGSDVECENVSDSFGFLQKIIFLARGGNVHEKILIQGLQ
jgi:hypothetical protein